MVKQQNIIKIEHDNELGYRWISKDKFDSKIHKKYQQKKTSQRKPSNNKPSTKTESTESDQDKTDDA
ncbi:UNVERIFIED_CONTAM: hypothetical protein BEN50_03255 [Euhalothece sp. KZN 001]